VRRRVYDALNVLIAAGIIQRNGKNVQYEPKIKYQVEKNGKNQQEVQSQLTQIRDEIDKTKDEIGRKRKQIKELKQKKRAVKNLIKRNQQFYYLIC
jgi:peptidoglycan hydrolase CwlO-like protein